MVLHRPRRDARSPGHGIHADTPFTARPLRSNRGHRAHAKGLGLTTNRQTSRPVNGATKYGAIKRCRAGRGDAHCARRSDVARGRSIIAGNHEE